MARFRRDKWPKEGDVRALLSYLDDLHEDAGRPSLSQIGRSVALAPSTLSAFFTGTRLIGRGNLELLVEHLGGDVIQAEQLRRKAVNAWQTPGNQALGTQAPGTQALGTQALGTQALGTQPRPSDRPIEHIGRFEIAVYTSPANKLNRPDRLLGRSDLMHRTGSLLESANRVLLYGLGGSGKTAMAATLADQRVESGKGPYLWLRPGLADADLALDALGRALSAWDTSASPGEGETVHDGHLRRLRSAVSDSGVSLCVIDDANQPAVLHALLRAMPEELPVLVTSRRKLTLDHQLEVTGLDMPDAVRLLALHAHADNLSGPEAAALCADLGHHPYAIEIAGQHLRQYRNGPAELRAQLDGAPHELAVPNGFAAPGRESIKRLLDHAVSALDSADAVAVLRGFGAFHSPGATVELLALYLEMDRTRVEIALRPLVDMSLAKRLARTSFYAVHDLTFSYCRALNGPQPESRIVAAVRAFVQAYRDDHDLLALELDNVLAAAALARRSEVDTFLAVIEDLAAGRFLNAKGHPLGLLRLLDDAIAILRARESQGCLHFLLSKRGNAHFNQGELETAIAVYAEALDRAPDSHRRVVLLSVIGKVLAELGSVERAESHFKQAYALCEATGDDHARLRVLEQHSVAAFYRKDFPLVLDVTSEGIELARRLGSPQLEMYFLNNHGTAQFELGLLAAIERHEQARKLAAELGNDHALALTHRALGADRHAQENFALAQEHFERALALYTKLGETGARRKLERLMHRFGYLK